MASSRKIEQASYEQVKLGHAALDGTKVQANAFKRKAMSYGRMKREIARLEGEVKQLPARAETVDAEEDAIYGAGNRGDELPKELRFRQQQLERKLRTKKDRAAQLKHKQTVKPDFGQIKEHRGFRRFLLRGLERVRAQWRLICLGHNLLKLFRSGALSTVT